MAKTPKKKTPSQADGVSDEGKEKGTPKPADPVVEPKLETAVQPDVEGEKEKPVPQTEEQIPRRSFLGRALGFTARYGTAAALGAAAYKTIEHYCGVDPIGKWIAGKEPTIDTMGLEQGKCYMVTFRATGELLVAEYTGRDQKPTINWKKAAITDPTCITYIIEPDPKDPNDVKGWVSDKGYIGNKPVKLHSRYEIKSGDRLSDILRVGGLPFALPPTDQSRKSATLTGYQKAK